MSAVPSARQTAPRIEPAGRLRRTLSILGPSRRLPRVSFLAGAAALVALALSSCVPSAALLSAGSTTASSVASGALPFNMPTSIAPGGNRRLAFAHYFTPFLSSDNTPAATNFWAKQWLTPTGEHGIHAAYGGFLRDQPLPPPPAAPSNYQFVDMQNEVREAIGGGLDGFTLDLLSASPSSYNYTRDFMMMDAAAATNPHFKIMIMPDMMALRSLSNAGMAALIAKLGAKPAAFRLADGRLVVSPFFAERHPASWWASTLSILRNQYRTNVAFVPCFLNFRGNARSFAPISYGFSEWGNRNPSGQSYMAADANYAHSFGKIWMAPVSVQDERPNQGIYDEAGNTENLRDSWTAAIKGNADWVQIPTWNDYSEGSQIAPTMKHGYSFLDLSAWYDVWWKTGAFPATVRDTLYVTHRTQMFNARPRFPETRLMRLRSGGTPARNTVEVVSVLTRPATVVLRVGGKAYSYTAPAGIAARDFPLGYGTVSASAARSGRVIASVTTPLPVTASPLVQDLQYIGASSRR